MTADEKDRPSDAQETDRLSLDEFRQLVKEAQERGEDTAPLLKRLVLQVIDEVRDGLEGERP